MIQKLTDFNRTILHAYLQPGMTVVDATVGNGHDALFIKECITDAGDLIGFDIQERAIENTRARLLANGFDHFKLHCADHSAVNAFLTPETIDAFVYNLGYLPTGDHQVTTQVEKTLLSVETALDYLKPHGVMCITAYPGHDEGKREFDALNNFFKTLNPKKFHVMICHYTNHAAHAPVTFLIEKHIPA